jgi:dTDP-4-dehydrorhamnose 3,5-epimerase
MEFVATPLAGAFVIELDRQEDERGFLARSFCADEFSKHGLNPRVVQCNVSYNRLRGTLRGFHYQTKPHEEAKLVRCTAGAIYDVIVDLRRASATYKRWFATELTALNRRMVFIPEGFAHAFQTLADNTEVFYQMSELYHPKTARGIRWNDTAFRVTWPISEPIISERDLAHPDFAQ